MSTSTTFFCKCGKQKGWITEGAETPSCPSCGRKYFGVYDLKSLTIKAEEMKRKGWSLG